MDVKILHNAHKLRQRGMITVRKRSIMPGGNRAMKKKGREMERESPLQVP